MADRIIRLNNLKERKFAMSKLKRIVDSNISLIMIFAGVIGYAAVCGWFFYEEIFNKTNAFDWFGNKKEFFNKNPGYLLWMASVVIQPVIWFIILIPATTIIRRLTNELRPEKHIWVSFFTIVLMFVIFNRITFYTFDQYFTRPGSLLINHIEKLKNFTIIGQVVGLYYLFGAVLVSKVSMKMVEEKRYDFLCYKRLKSYLEAVINFTAVIFTLGIISAMLFRKTINDDSLYPSEFLISLGILNSLLILILYLPAHFTLFYYGRKILENKFGSVLSEKESEMDVVLKQIELSKNLSLSLGIPQSIKTSLVILSPVISSFIPDLMKIFQK